MLHFSRPLLLTVICVSRSRMGVASSHWGPLFGGVSAADAESSLCACSHTRARQAARSQPAAGWALSRRRGSWPGFCSWAEQPESAVSLQFLLLLLCLTLSWSCWLFLKVLFHVQIKIKLHWSKNEKMYWCWCIHLDKTHSVKTKLPQKSYNVVFSFENLHKVVT